MFTGIIEAVGKIAETRSVPGGRRLTIDTGEIAQETKLGASVCVSGVCLTVAEIRPPLLDFDVVTETLRSSTIGDRKVGDRVNLERALRAGDPLDGHFVQGHVHGFAAVTRIDSDARQHVLWLRAEEELQRYIISKGSVAIDGVSLTVAKLAPPQFSVALIPTTLKETTLADLTIGDRVNVETDIVVRTVVEHLEAMSRPGGVTMDALRQAGFA